MREDAASKQRTYASTCCKNLTFWLKKHKKKHPRTWIVQARIHHPSREAQKWPHYIVGLLFSWREWCTLQNQLHHGGKRCGYIKAGSQDISSDVKSLGTNGRYQWTMTSLATIVTEMFQNGLKTTCQDQVLNWPWPWMCMQRQLQWW